MLVHARKQWTVRRPPLYARTVRCTGAILAVGHPRETANCGNVTGPVVVVQVLYWSSDKLR